MNANELADLLEQDIEEGFGLGFLKDAVTMLRQQQAEIEALKSKTLTDKEIKSEAMYFCHSYHSENPERLVLFARAILRKASEK